MLVELVLNANTFWGAWSGTNGHITLVFELTKHSINYIVKTFILEVVTQELLLQDLYSKILHMLISGVSWVILTEIILDWGEFRFKVILRFLVRITYIFSFTR